MADRYASIAELVKSERRDIDFRIRQSNRPGTIAVIAPHGGGIEPGTSEIAEAIAGAKYSFYAFEGIRAKGNRDLHVTSVRFDEPECVALVAASSRAIAIHGEGSTDPFVHLGGRDEETVDRLRICLERGGFRVGRDSRPGLSGRDPANICNRTLRGIGVQLELSLGLRSSCFHSLSRIGRRAVTPRFAEFVAAVHEGLESLPKIESGDSQHRG